VLLLCLSAGADGVLNFFVVFISWSDVESLLSAIRKKLSHR